MILPSLISSLQIRIFSQGWFFSAYFILADKNSLAGWFSLAYFISADKNPLAGMILSLLISSLQIRIFSHGWFFPADSIPANKKEGSVPWKCLRSEPSCGFVFSCCGTASLHGELPHISKIGGRFPGFLTEGPGKGRAAGEAAWDRNVGNGQRRICQESFRVRDADLGDILVEGHAHILLEHSFKVKFAEADSFSC